jgi:hypothetical protein
VRHGGVLCLAALAAPAHAAGAAAQPVSAIGKLGACAVVATCTDAGEASCRPGSGDQQIFTARVDGTNLIWVETAYSRFPQSDTNEETGFLPLTLLNRKEAASEIGDLTEGRRTIEGPHRALFGLMDGRSAGGMLFDLYQFNPRGLIRHWHIDCPMGAL